MGSVNTGSVRKSGIALLGDVKWGTHLCQFYKTKDDLLEILVPYFKAGLENNEFCMWVTSEPLALKDAVAAMKAAEPDFDSYARKGQIEIIPHTDWYLKGGFFDGKRVLNGWVDKLNNALKKGYAGLRLTGNTFWLEKKDWKFFSDYEEEVNNAIGNYKIVAICTYSLEKCGASEVADMITNHQFAIMKREGKWDIIVSSGQKEAMEALKKSEERYKLVEHAANIGSWDLNILSGDLELSGAMEPMFGFKQGGFGATYKAFLKSVHPDDRQRVIDAVNSCAEKGTDYQLEHRIVWPDGTTRWVLEIGNIIRDVNDKAVHMLGIVQDITERKKAEDALKKEKEFSESILGTMPDGVDIVDENLGITYMNKTLEDMFGKDNLGRKCYEVYKADKKQCENCPLKKPLDGRTENLEVSGIRDGRTFFISHTGIMLNGKNHFLEIFSDITERKKAEEQLRIQSAALTSAANAILLTNTEGAILWVNPAFTKLTGYAASEVIGKNPRILNSGKQSPEYYKSLWDTISSGKVWQGEVINKRKDGSLYTENMTIAPVRSKDGEIVNFVAIKEDITLHKKLEEELSHRAAELEAANQELEAFSYSTSHDLRSPLRSIDGFSQALLEDYGDKIDEQARDFLKRIRTATQRMGQLIDDLLKLSRITQTQLTRKETDLSGLARHIIARLKEAEPDRHVELVIAPGLVAKCDKQLITVAFENLISNAWKFTSKLPSARIEFGTAAIEGKPAYFIRDNGAGFDMAYAAKLFMPFQRLHSATEFPGTGIGLAIVSRIIARHGGRIWAEGTTGKGAAFYFTL